ncbi:MAG: TIGR00266 family protein [Spirochaetes bacterium]|nr:TIGR00266 family protein [Spirochaetota bacterium]MBN2771150.1 TIGR00266 family protein [Spirochaetota bacterium]
MDFKLKHQPSYSLVELTMNQGEQIRTEAGAMVYMSPDFKVETKFGSGFLSAIGNKFLGGESLFINEYTASSNNAVLGLATDLAGDVAHIKMNESTLILQGGAFLASSPGVNIKPIFGGIKSLIGKEGAFLLKASGTGDLFYTSYGAIVPIEVDGSYIVDTGHLVAFEENLTYKLKKASKGLLSTVTSGEGFVFEFSGNGKLWIQSRVPDGFISWISRLLPR